jgi:hypothetical protein
MNTLHNNSIYLSKNVILNIKEVHVRAELASRTWTNGEKGIITTLTRVEEHIIGHWTLHIE